MGFHIEEYICSRSSRSSTLNFTTLEAALAETSGSLRLVAIGLRSACRPAVVVLRLAEAPRLTVSRAVRICFRHALIPGVAVARCGSVRFGGALRS
eukprot:6591440-Alexandrium_andersonii.AAC.1